MKIIGLSHLHNFFQQYPDSKNWIQNWVTDTKNGTWRTSHDIKARYSSASFLAENKVIFNVRGNKYRLEVTIAYNTENVVVHWIGTHAEYTRRLRQ